MARQLKYAFETISRGETMMDGRGRHLETKDVRRFESACPTVLNF